MAYDEVLAARIREQLEDEPGVVEKTMFGGLAFLVDGHMAVAASNTGGVLLRADPQAHHGLPPEHVRPMEMGGRSMNGWLQVDPALVEGDEVLADVVRRGVSYVRTLPPK